MGKSGKTKAAKSGSKTEAKAAKKAKAASKAERRENKKAKDATGDSTSKAKKSKGKGKAKQKEVDDDEDLIQTLEEYRRAWEEGENPNSSVTRHAAHASHMLVTTLLRQSTRLSHSLLHYNSTYQRRAQDYGRSGRHTVKTSQRHFDR